MSLFISFEGIDGCGKSTHLDLLDEYLQGLGYSVLRPREPGGTAIGEKIRKILLEKTEDNMLAETELLLFLASRAQITREIIAPALHEGKVVICDRFMDSSVAYQGYGRALGPERVKLMNRFATGDIVPDITFLLDVDVEEARSRLDQRDSEKNRLDSETVQFMQTVREGFLAMQKAEPDRIKLVDTSGAKESTQMYIREIIRRYLK